MFQALLACVLVCLNAVCFNRVCLVVWLPVSLMLSPFVCVFAGALLSINLLTVKQSITNVRVLIEILGLPNLVLKFY